MVALKARDIEPFLKAPNKPIILVYGPNQGLVRERVDQLLAIYKVSRDDSFSYFRMEADRFTGNKTLLVEEAHSLSMFGSDLRVIHVRGSNAQVTAAVNLALANPPEENKIIIEAGDIQGRTGLRGAIEKSKIAAAIPCYADDMRSLGPYVESLLAAQGIKLEPNAKPILLSLMAPDRGIVKSEVERLALACYGQDTISVHDIEFHLMDSTTANADDISDAILRADMTKLLNSLALFLDNGGALPSLTANLQRCFTTLAEILLQAEHKSIENAVDSFKPPIFFKRKDAYKSAGRNWSQASVVKALERIAALEFYSRTRPNLSRADAERACLELIRLGRKR